MVRCTRLAEKKNWTIFEGFITPVYDDMAFDMLNVQLFIRSMILI